MSESASKKQWALQYAGMGFSVFPVKPQAKAPATAHGFKDATQDSGQIERWWTENPNYNIGIATGETAPGVFIIVIDIDRDSNKGVDGQKPLTEYERVHGPLPQTVESQTPRGGRHLLYKCFSPLGCKTNLYPGVDVRGVGGYIVAPPSVVNQKEYRWINPPVVTELAEADSNVYTFLSPVPDGFDRTSSNTAFQMPEEIGEGNRTNSLLKLLGSAVR